MYVGGTSTTDTTRLTYDTANMVEKLTSNVASESVSSIGYDWLEDDFAKVEC